MAIEGMEKGCITGQMEQNMKEFLAMISRMVLGFLFLMIAGGLRYIHVYHCYYNYRSVGNGTTIHVGVKGTTYIYIYIYTCRSEGYYMYIYIYIHVGVKECTGYYI